MFDSRRRASRASVPRISNPQVARRGYRGPLLGLLLLALAACSPALPLARVERSPSAASLVAAQPSLAPASAVPTAAPSSPPLPLDLPTVAPAPRPPEPTAVTPQPTPTLGPLEATARADLFDQVWSAVDSHYLYADFRGVDWEALKQQYRPQALAAPTMEQFYATLSRMVDQLDDHHSRFEDPQQAFARRALAAGEDAYVGVGVLTVPVDGGLLVTTVFPDSPASEAGIARRDVVVAVDGKPAAGDPRIRGSDGSRVTLTLRRPGGVERTVALVRRAVVAQYVPEAQVLPGTNVGYLLIQSFWPQDTADRTTAALEELLDTNGALDGLIVDVRGNGGGWRTVLQGLLGNFVVGDVGEFFSQASSYPLAVEAGSLRARLDGVPLVVLVDGDTESYAEVFAAVLQASGRADVVGAPSAGNTETIFAYDFKDGSRLWVAQEGFELPSGANLEGRGVQPDRALDVVWQHFSERDDPQILAALEMLSTTAGAK